MGTIDIVLRCYSWATFTKTESCHDVNFVAIGVIGGWHTNNPRYRQWRISLREWIGDTCPWQRFAGGLIARPGDRQSNASPLDHERQSLTERNCYVTFGNTPKCMSSSVAVLISCFSEIRGREPIGARIYLCHIFALGVNLCTCDFFVWNWFLI